MLHSIAIYKRIRDLLGQMGVAEKLGLKTISFGTLDNVPADADVLASWLPALLVGIHEIELGEYRASDPRGPVVQTYPIEIYLFRRYGADENTAIILHEWADILERAWTFADWGDRLQSPSSGTRGMAKIRRAVPRHISFDAREVLEARQDLAGLLSGLVFKAEIELLAFAGGDNKRKE